MCVTEEQCTYYGLAIVTVNETSTSCEKATLASYFLIIFYL